MPLTLPELREAIKDDRKDVDAALAFLERILKLDAKTSRYLTLRYLGKTLELTTAQAFDLATYFCGDRIALLTQKYDFITDEDDNIEIQGEDVSEAYRLGYLLHPKTGEPIEDWEKHVVVFYSVTDKLVELGDEQ